MSDCCYKVCWTLSRCAITAWVGASAIFVVTAVQEVSSVQFDSLTKAALATLRFPTYYAFAFTLVTTALVFGMAAGMQVKTTWKCRHFYLALLITALLLMLADYFFVYVPLQRIMVASEQARPANFTWYHTMSKWTNAVGFCLWSIASLTACWSERLVLTHDATVDRATDGA